jgi:hypothetical protein
MYEGSGISRVARRAVAIWLGAIILATVAPCSAALATDEKAAASPKTRELMTLLAQQWLEEQGVAKSTPAPAVQQTDDSVDFLSSSAGAIHDQIVALARAIPDLPNEFERAAARVTMIDPIPGGARFSSSSASSGIDITSRPDAVRPRLRFS